MNLSVAEDCKSGPRKISGDEVYSGSLHCGDRNLVISISLQQEAWLVGLKLLCRMISGPILGALCDYHGRVLLCLVRQVVGRIVELLSGSVLRQAGANAEHFRDYSSLMADDVGMQRDRHSADCVSWRETKSQQRPGSLSECNGDSC